MATFITIKNIFNKPFRAGGVTVAAGGQAIVDIESSSVRSSLYRYRSYWVQLSGTPTYKYTYDFGVDTGYYTINETWTITVDATGGKFKVTDGTTTTAELFYNVTAATTFQSALEAFPSIGAGMVTVTGGPGDAGGTAPYTVVLSSTLGTFPVLVASTGVITPLTGGASTAVAAKTVAGHKGIYTLTAPNGQIPDNFIITEVIGEVETAFTSVGAPSIDVGITGNDDLFYNNKAKAFFGTDVINVQSTTLSEGDGGVRKMTAARDVTLTVGTADLTAGKLHVYVTGIPGV